VDVLGSLVGVLVLVLVGLLVDVAVAVDVLVGLAVLVGVSVGVALGASVFVGVEVGLLKQGPCDRLNCPSHPSKIIADASITGISRWLVVV
jgi:hypothetical protein